MPRKKRDHKAEELRARIEALPYPSSTSKSDELERLEGRYRAELVALGASESSARSTASWAKRRVLAKLPKKTEFQKELDAGVERPTTERELFKAKAEWEYLVSLGFVGVQNHPLESTEEEQRHKERKYAIVRQLRALGYPDARIGHFLGWEDVELALIGVKVDEWKEAPRKGRRLRV